MIFIDLLNFICVGCWLRIDKWSDSSVAEHKSSSSWTGFCHHGSRVPTKAHWVGSLVDLTYLQVHSFLYVSSCVVRSEELLGMKSFLGQKSSGTSVAEVQVNVLCTLLMCCLFSHLLERERPCDVRRVLQVAMVLVLLILPLADAASDQALLGISYVNTLTSTMRSEVRIRSASLYPWPACLLISWLLGRPMPNCSHNWKLKRHVERSCQTEAEKMLSIPSFSKEWCIYCL
jgi:hypothetical protein